MVGKHCLKVLLSAINQPDSTMDVIDTTLMKLMEKASDQAAVRALTALRGDDFFLTCYPVF